MVLFQLIFEMVAGVLNLIALCTGLIYNKVNIIMYYFIVLISWIFLLDKNFRVHYLKILFSVLLLIFCIWCKDFSEFSDLMFGESVYFLNYYNCYFGNYIASSVVICVFIPVVVYAALIYAVVRRKRQVITKYSKYNPHV
jgi:hypothetical protein